MPDSDPTAILTLRLKVKREAYHWLNAAAAEVNQVWNFCSATSKERHQPFVDDYGMAVYPKRLSGFDLCNLTAGTSRYMRHIGASTIQRVCVEYARKLNAIFPKRHLSWRASGGAKRALGWAPFKGVDIRRKGVGVRFCGKFFRVFEAERLDGVKFRDGCFAQDAVGDWWLCVPVTANIDGTKPERDAVGVDLGIKDVAVTSDGDRLTSAPYRAIEAKIAQAQRRGHKQQTKRLHRKAANQRRDALNKFSTMLVRKYQRIYVGDVSSTKLAKTRMAKSVLDAGWGLLRTQLKYKCQQAGREFVSVNERFTTRACSSCGSMSGPSGLRQLAVREWTCADCETVHDRDVNAAKNILALRYPASVCGNEPRLAA